MQGDSDRASEDVFDPYEVLQVSREASAVEIRRQFREFVKECHPDLGGGPEQVETLRRVVLAYRTLSQRSNRPDPLVAPTPPAPPSSANGRLGELLKTSDEHLANHAWEAAETLCRMVIRDDPRSVPAYINLAIALEALGSSAEAIGCFTLALQIDPRNQRAKEGLRALRS